MKVSAFSCLQSCLTQSSLFHLQIAQPSMRRRFQAGKLRFLQRSSRFSSDAQDSIPSRVPRNGGAIPNLATQLLRHHNSVSQAAASGGCVTKDEGSGEAANLAAFSWEKQWYAAALVEDLDNARPHATTVLGLAFVLWYSPHPQGGGQWRAFLDACPHRLAPLSEGRVDERGWLQCSYHGWSFNGEGGCEIIPQASPSGPEAAAVRSPRACATAVPVKELGGILWLWPDHKSRAEAENTEPSLSPGDHWSGMARDYFVDYEVFAENCLDPAHIPVAHHGLGRLRRSSARALEIRLGRLTPGGFTGTGPSSVHEGGTFEAEFAAPGRVSYKFRIPDQKGGERLAVTTLYFTPMREGCTRIFVMSSGSILPSWFRKVLPAWAARAVYHVVTMAVTDGDAMLQHGQVAALGERREELRREYSQPQETEEELTGAAAGGAEESVHATVSFPWGRVDFNPTASDRMVLAFRQWLHKYGGGKVHYPTTSPSRPSPSAPTSPTLPPATTSQPPSSAPTPSTSTSNDAQSSLTPSPISPTTATNTTAATSVPATAAAAPAARPSTAATEPPRPPPPRAPPTPPPRQARLPRQVVLDRLSQHTEGCASCQRAVGFLEGVKRAAVVLGAAMGLAVAVLSTRLPLWARCLAALVVCASAALAYAMTIVLRQFSFTDYRHANIP